MSALFMEQASKQLFTVFSRLLFTDVNHESLKGLFCPCHVCNVPCRSVSEHGLAFSSTSSPRQPWSALITLPKPSPLPPRSCQSRGHKSLSATWLRSRLSEHLISFLHRVFCAITAPSVLFVNPWHSTWPCSSQEVVCVPASCLKTRTLSAPAQLTFLQTFGLPCRTFVGSLRNQ